MSDSSRDEQQKGGVVSLVKVDFSSSEVEAPGVDANEDYFNAYPRVYALMNRVLRFPEFEDSPIRRTNIKLLMKRKQTSALGLYQVRSFGTKDKLYHGYEFEILLSEFYWGLAEARKEGRDEQIMFEALSLLWIDDNGKPKILKPDIELTQAFVLKYGTQAAPVRKLQDLIDQNLERRKNPKLAKKGSRQQLTMPLYVDAEKPNGSSSCDGE